jgi:hypothetical protein
MIDRHNGINPRNEMEQWCDWIAYGIVTQGHEYTHETRVEWLRTGFCTQHELNRISELVKDYRAEMGRTAIIGEQQELWEGWNGLN